MKNKNALKSFFALVVLSLFGFAPVAAATGSFGITDVNFDDFNLAPGGTLKATVTLTNSDLVQDVESITVRAWLTDHNNELVGDKQKLDVVQVRQDADKDVVFNIAIPSDAEEDIYTLHVTAEGKWEDSNTKVTSEWTGSVEVTQQDDAFAVTDIKLSSGTATAGDAVDVSVTVLNTGKTDESNVKVKASVDGAEQTVTIDNLMEGAEQTVYLTLKLPSDLASGIQTVKVQVYNSAASDVATKDLVVEAAAPVAKPVAQTPTFSLQTIPAGKGSIFSLQIANNAATPKTYNLAVGGVQDWAANVRVDPTTVTLGAGEATTVQVYLVPTVSGEHAFALFVKDGANTIASQAVKVNVAGGTSATSGSGWSTGGLLALVLVVLAVAFAWKQSNGNGKRKETVYF